jgi:energy-coupling factor transport system substrate-specific component
MTTTTMPRAAIWEVNSRTIVYAAIGAALYGVLGYLVSIVIPGSNNVAVRPAFALVPFFGIAFGPIVGFFTGFVGNIIIDQLSGYGAFTAWNWSLANGLVGLLAGILAAIPMSVGGEGTTGKVLKAAGIAAIATAVGMLFVLTDVFVFGNSFEAAVTGSYLWVLWPNLIAAVILTPILVAAWEPIKASIGR